jgi:hypothetical protein
LLDCLLVERGGKHLLDNYIFKNEFRFFKFWSLKPLFYIINCS